MKIMLKKFLTTLQILNPLAKSKSNLRKTKAQSLVEFAITLPIIIVLLSGVVEFGFALNYYLSLLDATREAARFGSGSDPFMSGYGSSPNTNFYSTVAGMVASSLDPKMRIPTYEGRRIPLDSTIDDVIVTVYGINNGVATQFPTTGPYKLFGNQNSVFTATSIQSQFTSSSPNAGVLVVEVHYNYRMVLNLPWLSPFVPNPMMMRSYTIMPLGAAEPPN